MTFLTSLTLLHQSASIDTIESCLAHGCYHLFAQDVFVSPSLSPSLCLDAHCTPLHWADPVALFILSSVDQCSLHYEVSLVTKLTGLNGAFLISLTTQSALHYMSIFAHSYTAQYLTQGHGDSQAAAARDQTATVLISGQLLYPLSFSSILPMGSLSSNLPLRHRCMSA